MNYSTSKKPFPIIPKTSILLTSLMLFLIPHVKSQHDYNSLVYVKCANQTHTSTASTDPNSLSSLFQQLLPQSSHSNFFKATAGGDQTAGISGLYQCRGNLHSQQQCYHCINTLPQHLITCKQAVAGRIELNGCYFEYETDEFVEETGEGKQHELIHEICSEEKGDFVGFVEVRDAAFLGMEEGLMSEKGYYETDYENVHVIGECERDLIGCDCSECLGIAAEIAQQDCGSSIWGKIYLDKCFLSYALNLYPGTEERERKGETGKKVAIVLGAATAMAGGLIFLRCMTSRCNNKDDE